VQVINQTPVPVRLDMGQLDGTTSKFGMLTAKATFRVNAAGVAELETQSPFPILEQDHDGELGLLPRDTLARRDAAFEVIAVGAAYSARLVPHSWIELRVGPHVKRLRVSGDREWLASSGHPVISAPVPFQRLDLGWHRAFGGATEVMLDADTPFELTDPFNRFGRGFDAEKLARDYGEALRAQSGYPKLSSYRRLLPNIEDPSHLITSPTEVPLPVCWGTVPMECGFLYKSATDAAQASGKPETMAENVSRYYHRAHPDWIIERPSEASPVELFGMMPDQPLQFRLPRLRVLADYELGSRRGTRELEPHLLLLLPEKSSFYLVYRHFFTMSAEPHQQRSFRLRLAEGWAGAGQTQGEQARA
jgi:hypothetical protein